MKNNTSNTYARLIIEFKSYSLSGAKFIRTQKKILKAYIHNAK